MDIDYQITGMHCAACVKRVTAALQPFANTVTVTLEPPVARLIVDKLPAAEALRDAVSAAGQYTIAPQVAVAAPVAAAPESKSWLSTYYPLLLIAVYIAIASFAGTTNASSGIKSGIDWSRWMTNVMAGFFLVFSAFKFLDLRGFAQAYSSYDLGAQRWQPWGTLYPFLELSLGLAYLFHWAPVATDIATIALMGFSSLGVIRALANKQQIRCACLGTVLNVPMSTITLAEDLAMVVMALMHLGMGRG